MIQFDASQVSCTPKQIASGHGENLGFFMPAESSEWTDGLNPLYPALCGHQASYRPLRRTSNGTVEASRAITSLDTCRDKLSAGWSLVAPCAPDLVVFDLDGCATAAVLGAMDIAARHHGAHLAYRAQSGSSLSEHRAYAVPGRYRQAFRQAVSEIYISEGSALEDRTADQSDSRQRAGRGLRLPGSPSLKVGITRLVWPVDADGCPLDFWQAAKMIARARSAAGLAAQPVPLTASSRSVVATTATDTNAPTRPFRARRKVAPIVGTWDRKEQEILLSTPVLGRRSDAALHGLRIVIHRMRSTDWTVVAPIVMSCPVFKKFSIRGEEAAQRWWDKTSQKYLRYRSSLPSDHRLPTDADHRLVTEWLRSATVLFERCSAEVAARVYRALIVIGERVMLDGRGLHDRPVAVRDLVAWGVCHSVDSAWQTLQEARKAGLLIRTRRYSLADPLKADCWSLPERGDSERTRVHTPERTPTLPPLPHPSSLTDAHLSWRPLIWLAHHTLLHSSLRTSTLAQLLHITPRSARRLLCELRQAGAVACSGDLWSATSHGTAPRVAMERLWDARARVEVERTLWREALVDMSTRLGNIVANLAQKVCAASTTSEMPPDASSRSGMSKCPQSVTT